jgi:hypothetical protein
MTEAVMSNAAESIGAELEITPRISDGPATQNQSTVLR